MTNLYQFIHNQFFFFSFMFVLIWALINIFAVHSGSTGAAAGCLLLTRPPWGSSTHYSETSPCAVMPHEISPHSNLSLQWTQSLLHQDHHQVLQPLIVELPHVRPQYVLVCLMNSLQMQTWVSSGVKLYFTKIITKCFNPSLWDLLMCLSVELYYTKISMRVFNLLFCYLCLKF
jgi:hypothetical protein